MCLSGVDYPKETPPRIEVVYHLYSYAHRHLFVLKVDCRATTPRVQSVEGVWGRQLARARGLRPLRRAFAGHPDLRRILLPDDWAGTRCARTGRTPTSTTACT